jgi:4'-phosphopantetheinyl transferase
MPQSTVDCFTQTVMDWLPEEPDWSANDLAVFRCHLPDFIPFDRRLSTQLQPDEYSRGQRYLRSDDRHRFMYTRALLRMLIGHYCQLAPASVPLHTTQYGKPTLLPELGKHVNVTHAGNWSVLAIGPSAVGVDLENAATGLEFQDIASLSFSQQEQYFLREADDPRAVFFQLWTRKEALIKATGRGISDALADIPVLDGHHTVSDVFLGEPGPWLVTSFNVATDYPAALAHRPTASPIRFYTLTPSWLFPG